MNNKKHKRRMRRNSIKHANKILKILREDPNADKSTKNYTELEQYLLELIDKDGSLMEGIIIACEKHLEK